MSNQNAHASPVAGKKEGKSMETFNQELEMKRVRVESYGYFDFNFELTIDESLEEFYRGHEVQYTHRYRGERQWKI